MVTGKLNECAPTIFVAHGGCGYDKRKCGDVMNKVAAQRVVGVVVPYYQRDAGILRRAVQSVCDQDLPADVIIKLVIVDDQSPHPAKLELDGTIFPPNVHLKVIEQPNGGPGVARNTGLDQLGNEVGYVAFLDSDDIWNPHHLRVKLEIMERGADFVFCDNRREGHHGSFLQSCAPNTVAMLNSAKAELGEYRISAEALIELVIVDFPAQLSTVLFRRAMGPLVRFDTSLRCSGEDVLYLVSLLSNAGDVVFDDETVVDCGEGVNMYFSNFGWDSPEFLKILRDHVFCYSRLNKLGGLSVQSREKNLRILERKRLDFAFHSLRRMVKSGGQFPQEVRDLCVKGKMGWVWWLRAVSYIAWAYPLRKYRP